jgi:hypothetical protein
LLWQHGTSSRWRFSSVGAASHPLGYDPVMAAPRDPASFTIEREALEAEVTRIVTAGDAAGIPVRALGSVGVALHCPASSALLPRFERTYADIDLATYRRNAKELTALLVAMGYRDDRAVFIASEGSRSIFDDPARRTHLDVFYDRLDFCHVIPLTGRLEVDRPTIPLAELLLSKLQIVRINKKDVVDAILLLLDHPFGAGDAGVIDTDRIAALAGEDWGLWRTLTMNLEKVAALAGSYPELNAAQGTRVEGAVSDLKSRIDSAPRSFAWRMRARVGDRRQWWTEVDEVH